jgi:multidrug efflux pump subunit AcrA (membrane-fusion protein)
MRKQLFSVLALSFSFTAFTAAQDAAQQAAQAAQQANQLAIQQAQAANAEAIRQAQLASQQAQQNAANAANNANTVYVPFTAAKPSISLKSGKYSSPVTIRLKTLTRGAVIHYTTDGWTPTDDSPRYTGPLTISSTTNLQAIAVAPNLQRSMVASAQFNFPDQSIAAAPSAPLPTPAQDPTGKYILPCDTPVYLAFSEDVHDKKVAIGDKLPLVLAQDLAAGDMVFARKGTPVDAVVAESDGSHAGGVPGFVAFEVRSFQAGGATVYLHGHAAKEGQFKPPNATVLIPVVGLFGLFRHGEAVNIKKGTPFIAYLAQDSLLEPIH